MICMLLKLCCYWGPVIFEIFRPIFNTLILSKVMEKELKTTSYGAVKALRGFFSSSARVCGVTSVLAVQLKD